MEADAATGFTGFAGCHGQQQVVQDVVEEDEGEEGNKKVGGQESSGNSEIPTQDDVAQHLGPGKEQRASPLSPQTPDQRCGKRSKEDGGEGRAVEVEEAECASCCSSCSSEGQEEEEEGGGAPGAVVVVVAGAAEERMSEMPEGEDGWRPYYEHPLTAATTAMLNINGGGDDQSAGIGILYDYYKPQIDKAVVKASNNNNNNSNANNNHNNTNGSHDKYPAIGDLCWGRSTGPSGGNNHHSKEPNGSTVVVVDEDHEDVQVYLGVVADTVIVKREPEDLTRGRRSSSSSPASSTASSSAKEIGHRLSSPLTNGAGLLEVEVDHRVKVELSCSRPGPGPDPDGKSPQPLLRENGTTTGKANNMAASSSSSSSSSSGSPYAVQAFANLPPATVGYDHVTAYGLQGAQSPQAHFTIVSSGVVRSANPVYSMSGNTDFYRDYYGTGGSVVGSATDQYSTVRQQLGYGGATGSDGGDGTSTQVQAGSAAAGTAAGAGGFGDRYGVRQGAANYKASVGLTVDLPSPDSGIGEAAITPRDNAGLPQIFDYSELSQGQMLGADTGVHRAASATATRRPWHDFSRSSEAEKIQIPKVFSNVGFRYFLESPISTSQRREDDRITYINKGQFYGITLEYIPDPEKPLKNQTVKTIIMLVFREEKSPEDEIKAWQFWHSRQHSIKQRILDADTKNSSGLVGCIEEVTHNAIVVYWNPLESSAKVNIAVQCLSTDFSNQKGVKGLPLHLQIDTYEDVRDAGPPVHRGYCQIKVFCDKGAERKTRDEERRAAKRKMTATGRKKIDELYHSPCDRSEFYAMSDLLKPPILFSPAEDLDKITSMEINFYSPAEDASISLDKPKSEVVDEQPEAVFSIPPVKRAKVSPPNDRVMLYIREDEEEVYTPLHLVPPSVDGLANAIQAKYKICASEIKNLYKRSKKGITVRMDDDMIRHYCNEDTFLISFSKLEEGGYDVTLTEL